MHYAVIPDNIWLRNIIKNTKNPSPGLKRGIQLFTIYTNGGATSSIKFFPDSGIFGSMGREIIEVSLRWSRILRKLRL